MADGEIENQWYANRKNNKTKQKKKKDKKLKLKTTP
jgi:hypothetical protein